MKFELRKKDHELEVSLVESGKFDTYLLQYDQIERLHEFFKHNKDSEKSIEIESFDNTNRKVTLILRIDYSGMCIIIYDIEVNNVRYFRLSSLEEQFMYQYVSDIVIVSEIERKRELDLIRLKYESIILNVEDAEDIENEDLEIDYPEKDEVYVESNSRGLLEPEYDIEPENNTDNECDDEEDIYNNNLIWNNIINSGLLSNRRFIKKILNKVSPMSSNNFNYYYSRYASNGKRLLRRECECMMDLIRSIYRNENYQDKFILKGIDYRTVDLIKADIEKCV